MTPKSLIAPARLARRPVLATQTDARLVDLVRAGYEPAFEAIVTRYRGALLRYAERFLPRERAEDAVQQSFVSAYEAMLRDRAELNLRPWLYRIAHNTALNALRDRGVRHDELDERIDGVERPDQALERSQGLREVIAAVRALPERQRDAIVLRELEGRSYEEIAAELGVSDGSVRQLLNRARNTLRAGATAVTPAELLLRMPWPATTDPIATRVAEVCGAAGSGAVVAKVCATALVTGAVVGGVAVAPERGTDEAAPDRAAAAPSSVAGADSAPSSGDGTPGGSTATGVGGSGEGTGDRDGDESGSSRGDEDNEGPSRGDEGDGDSSGPGSGDQAERQDEDSSREGRAGSGSGRGGHDGGGGGGTSGSGSGGDGSGSDGGDSSGSGSGSSGNDGSGGGSGSVAGDSSESGSGSGGGDGGGDGSGSGAGDSSESGLLSGGGDSGGDGSGGGGSGVSGSG